MPNAAPALKTQNALRREIISAFALGHHRFEWLYVTGFVEPATGRTVWNIANAICKELFELILADFAKSVGAGPDKRIVLQLDNAGWHGPENLAIPDGNRSISRFKRLLRLMTLR
jgi:hypothetical protein